MKKLVFTMTLLGIMASGGFAQNLTSVNFQLRDVEGDEWSFQEFMKSVRGTGEEPRKGAVMISFWALWCTPCKKEMNAMKEYIIEFQEQGKNVHYVAINLDKTRSLARVRSWLASKDLPYVHLVDPNSEIFAKLNGQSMPYSLILNEQAELIAKRTGYFAGDENEIVEDMRKIVE